MKVTCTSCGNRGEFSTEGTYSICDYCGARVQVMPPVHSEPAMPAQPAAPQAVATGLERPRNNLLAVIGFVISIVGLVLGFITCGMLSFLCLISLAVCGVALRKEPRGLAIGGIVASLIGLIPFAFLLGMFGLQGKVNENRKNARNRLDTAIESIPFESIDPETFESFPALIMIPQGSFNSKVSVAQFDVAGPDEATAMPTDDELRQITFDTQRMRYYAISNREFGRISKTGAFSPISVDDKHAGKMSSPRGVAYLPEDDRLIVFVSNGALYFSDESGEWEFVQQSGRAEYVALIYSPDERLFYALAKIRGKPAGTYDLVRLSKQLAVARQTRLSHPLPVASLHDGRIQMAISGDKLIAVTAPQGTDSDRGMQLFSIDPESGDVRRLKPDAANVEPS